MKFKLFQIKILKLFIKLKFLNEIMGREDSVEFYINFYFKVYIEYIKIYIQLVGLLNFKNFNYKSHKLMKM